MDDMWSAHNTIPMTFLSLSTSAGGGDVHCGAAASTELVLALTRVSHQSDINHAAKTMN